MPVFLICDIISAEQKVPSFEHLQSYETPALSFHPGVSLFKDGLSLDNTSRNQNLSLKQFD